MLIATVSLLNFLIAFYVIFDVPMTGVVHFYSFVKVLGGILSVVRPVEVVFFSGLILEVVFLVDLV